MPLLPATWLSKTRRSDSSLSDDEDLLEGDAEEELKAAEDAEVNLPKVSTRASKVRRRCGRHLRHHAHGRPRAHVP